MKHRSRVGRNSLSLYATLFALFCLSLVPGRNLSAAQKRVTPVKSRGRVGRVQTGLDVLEAQKFAPLRGKHVGLITNHTGMDFNGRSTIDLLAHVPGVQLVALFSPEHGIAGHADEKVASSQDPSTGLPIYSLYGDTKRPTAEML